MPSQLQPRACVDLDSLTPEASVVPPLLISIASGLWFSPSKMQSFRSLRPIASRLQTSTLPRVSRASFSASTRMSYEYIQVSEPKPGVGQGMHGAALGYHTHALLSNRLADY